MRRASRGGKPFAQMLTIESVSTENNKVTKVMGARPLSLLGGDQAGGQNQVGLTINAPALPPKSMA